MIQFSEFRNWKKWCIQFVVVILAVIFIGDHSPQNNTFVMIAVIASWFPIWSKGYPIWSRILGFILGAFVSLFVFGSMLRFAGDYNITVSPLLVGAATFIGLSLPYPLTRKIVIWLASDGAKRIKQKIMEAPLTANQRIAVMGVLLWGAFVISLDSILNFTDHLAEGALAKIIILPLVVVGLATFLWRWATYTNRD